MPLSQVSHHAMLNHLASVADTVGLCLATALAADVAIGANSVQVDHAVGIGDWISLNDDGEHEEFRVTNVTGSGPYTCTLDHVTENAYGENTFVGHAPIVFSRVRQPSGGGYVTKAITWNAAASDNLDSSNAPNFNVPGDSAIGGFWIGSDSTPTNYYGAFLTGAIEYLGLAGTYTLTDADVSLTSAP